MKKLPPKAKLLCTISIFCLLLGCTSQTHVFKDEMKVEKYLIFIQNYMRYVPLKVCNV